MRVIIGILGVLAILAIAFALSSNRRAIRPRVVISAFLLQVVVAVLVLYLPAGRAVIAFLAGGVEALLGYAGAGISMVFGPLAEGETAAAFAISVLPIIIFFASLMSVLYYLGIMQRVVSGVGRALQWAIGSGPVESLNAAANIFVGQTEAPLVIKPYLAGLTRAQLFTVMVSGMASVSGTVLAAYAQMGIAIEYLLAASFMAAPGGLLMAKIVFPDDPEEEDAQQRDLVHVPVERGEGSNVIMAAATGALDGLKLAVNIAAMLIAFVSLIALVNGLIGMVAGWFGLEGITAQLLLGYVFAPLMFLLNVPWSEAVAAGGIFGEKLILNEFVAFLSLADMAETLSPRTVAVMTFALCGFANLSSIAIQLGGIGALIPGRMNQIAGFGVRAVIAGSLSNLMSAALAGLLLAG